MELSIKKVSFGKMDIIHRNGNTPVIEHLIFEKEGRPHKHKEYESFYVISGEGRVICGERVFDVSVGSLVTIPPNTTHWMTPSSNINLEGLLWYHETSLKVEVAQ